MDASAAQIGMYSIEVIRDIFLTYKKPLVDVPALRAAATAATQEYNKLKRHRKTDRQ
jgi:hypothetical protein